MNGLNLLLKYARGMKWWLIGIVIAVNIENAAGMLMTYVQKFIIDDIFVGGRYSLFVPVVMVFVLAFVLFNGLNIVVDQLKLGADNRVQLVIMRDVMERIHTMPAAQFLKERTAKLVHHVTSDVPNVSELLTSYIPYGIQQLVRVVILLFIVWTADPFLLAMVLGITFVYIVVGKKLMTGLKALSRQTQESRTEMQVVIEEGLSSTREVIAYDQTKWELDRYLRVFNRVFGHMLAEVRAQNKSMLLSDPLRMAGIMMTVGYGSYSVFRESMTLGTFIILYHFSGQLMDTIRDVYTFLQGFAGRMASVDRLLVVVAGGGREQGSVSMSVPFQAIRLDDVTFSYEKGDQTVLHHITAVMEAGRKTAFVGKSGSGKSTIVQLLLRNYAPQSGSILVGDVRLERMRKSDWVRSVCCVSQEPFLFADSIRHNLKLGRPYSDEDMMTACRTAEIHEYISFLPDGYDTMLGERGLNLSGGQRQRLAIARALLSCPEILIMDEATSALDLETERRVLASLDQLRRGKTTIVIAHRLSTVENADVIYVMDRGRLIEAGTHQQLLAMNSAYTGLAQAAAVVETG